MLRFVLVRLVHGLVVVFLVTTLVFVILHLAPRDPVTLLIGEARMTPSRSSTSAASGGSTSRLHIQYLRWLRTGRCADTRDETPPGSAGCLLRIACALLSSRRGSLLHEWVIGSYLGVGSAWSRAISSER